MTDKTKQYLFKGGGIISSLAPLGITVAVNNQEYFKNGNTTDISIGLLLVAVMVAIYTSGKVEFIKGIRGMWLILFIGFFLQSMLNDFVLLWGMFCAGETVSIPLNYYADKIKDNRETIEKAKLIQQANDEYNQEKLNPTPVKQSKKKVRC